MYTQARNLMFLLLTALTVILMFLTVFIPAHRARQERTWRDFEDEFRRAKLAAVRAYYPELHGLSDRQIRLRYDYEDAYWKMR